MQGWKVQFLDSVVNSNSPWFVWWLVKFIQLAFRYKSYASLSKHTSVFSFFSQASFEGNRFKTVPGIQHFLLNCLRMHLYSILNNKDPWHAYIQIRTPLLWFTWKMKEAVRNPWTWVLSISHSFFPCNSRFKSVVIVLPPPNFMFLHLPVCKLLVQWMFLLFKAPRNMHCWV